MLAPDLFRDRLASRKIMQTGWAICATRPADRTDGLSDRQTEDVADKTMEWVALPTLMPVAAALKYHHQGGQKVSNFRVQADALDWWYRLRFDAFDDRSTNPVICTLGVDGLATLASLWLNGRALGQSANMFVSHEFDITGLLSAHGKNELLIRFDALDVELEKKRKRPRWRTPMVAHQQLRWVRTSLLGRTPGWSPPTAVVGPWRDVWLKQQGALELSATGIETIVDGHAGVLTCRPSFFVPGNEAIVSVELQVERLGRTYTKVLTVCEDLCTYVGALRIDNVVLWWPHTHGEPALYRATLRVQLSNQNEALVLNLNRVGFRTMGMDLADGNFAFRVNDTSIFCRGACWAPLDSLMLNSTDEACRAAVLQARAAGMNMLRVSGTMVYEQSHFYEACDELGMLVWQDLMFANMDYPANDADFLASVTLEVHQQLGRLKRHACLALICGNSEVSQQAAMWGADRALWQPGFFEETLRQICADVAPDTDYWPSSAHGGAFPHQTDAGTTSYYGVGAYLRPLDDARRANLKFATECLAFANIPNDTTIHRMPGGHSIRSHHAAWKERSPRDLGAGWDFDDVRDHYLEALFGVDSKKLRSTDYERYLTLSRLTSGEVMAACFAEWRRPGSGCNGALILFLRDLWAGAGWGLVDDMGEPKACYYYLKRVLQPFSVLLTDEGLNGLQMHVVNEGSEAKNVQIELSVWQGGDVLVAVGSRAVEVNSRATTSLACTDFFEHFMDLTYAYRFGPLPFNVVLACLKDEAGLVMANTFYFPNGLNFPFENDVGLAASATMLNSSTALLTLSTKRFAFGVHLDFPGFVAEDDYFHLASGALEQIVLKRADSDDVKGSAATGWVQAANSATGAHVVATDSGVANISGNAEAILYDRS